jgi:hypothetical protein
LERLSRIGLNWATDPPSPWMKTSNGAGQGLLGSLLSCG